MTLTDDEKQWITADQPIASRADDRLSRSEFSKELATAVAGWRGNSSLTIALYGAWGSGKSSVKNMAVEYLREQSAPRPTIIEFNPWRWNNADELAEAFFREIGKGLGKGDDAAKAKKLSNLWRKYSASLSLAVTFVGAVPKLIGVILTLAGVLSLAGYVLAMPQAARGLAGLLASVAPLVVGLLVWSGGLSEKLAKYFEAKSAASERSLDERRNDLETELKTRDAPVVVIVDDIDRLAADRIALMFQLIKATADLPKFVYLLLFQRETIEKSLNAVSNGEGARFLEKIVQIGLDLPHLAKAEVEKILFDGLDAILLEAEAPPFDQTRWGNMYVGGLNSYFRTVRDVKRYLASLKFHIPLFKSGASFEVNVIDLIVVEAMRVFEPHLYLKLRSAKELLTNPRSSDRSDTSIRKAALEGIVGEATDGRKKELQELLVRLFPQVAWVFGGMERSVESYERWLKELRICSPDVYDKYLHFSVLPNDISQAELNDLLTLSSDRKKLRESLRTLQQKGLASVALDRLDANRELISRESAVPFITALFDVGDELNDVDSPGSIVGPQTYLARLIRRYLLDEQNAELRLDIIVRAIRETTGLIQPVRLTDRETDEKSRSESPEKVLVTDTEARELVALCVQKIRDSAANGELSKNRHLATLLYRWLKWDSPEEVRKWAANLCAAPQGALVLLNALTHRGFSQTIGDHVGRVTTRVSLAEIEKFVELSSLDEQIEKLSQSDRSEDERAAIQEFQKAVSRRREGKPEREFLDHDD